MLSATKIEQAKGDFAHALPQPLVRAASMALDAVAEALRTVDAATAKDARNDFSDPALLRWLVGQALYEAGSALAGALSSDESAARPAAVDALTD
jgi:hypothetical protein